MRKDILNSIIQMGEVKDLINKSEIARRFDCSINTVNKYLKDKGFTGPYGTVSKFIKEHKQEEQNKATMRFEGSYFLYICQPPKTLVDKWLTFTTFFLF